MGEDKTSYWTKHWDHRLQEGASSWNVEKLFKLLYELAKRPFYKGLMKLEIGCGSCIHADMMRQVIPGWTDNYLGFDLCENAVDRARKLGIAAVAGDFLRAVPDERTENKFRLVLLLDSLEHLGEDLDPLAKKIDQFVARPFTVFGNAPLFIGREALKSGAEHPVTVKRVYDFLEALRVNSIYHEIYGVGGFPFVLFEASSK